MPTAQTQHGAETLALMRLQLTPGLGRKTLLQLLKHFHSGLAILELPRTVWPQAGIASRCWGPTPPADDPQVQRQLQQLEQLGGCLISSQSDDYPALLATIPDAPPLLYLYGTIPDQPALAIVGSRQASRDGLLFARQLSADLARAGFCIVSGAARGIDCAAHEGALKAGGSSLAILGNGLDIPYPPTSRHLYQTIPQRGALISEYPPGTVPHPSHFPARNRIISGLCQGIVVIEAGQRSGSLITAEFALEQGRDVFAVPGSCYTPNSQGSLQLLKDGATLITCAEDILEAYHLSARPTAKPPQPLATELTETQQQILQLLENQAKHVDELAGESGLTPMEVSAIVLHLELQGLVTAQPGAYYTAR
ncbi:MAG: DNA-processing protein DprA [Desulfuromonadaceae bacterium]|nr:DNA-processing protein DprA [Desulfuromonadaceae bacterium]